MVLYDLLIEGSVNCRLRIVTQPLGVFALKLASGTVRGASWKQCSMLWAPSWSALEASGRHLEVAWKLLERLVNILWHLGEILGGQHDMGGVLGS